MVSNEIAEKDIIHFKLKTKVKWDIRLCGIILWPILIFCSLYIVYDNYNITNVWVKIAIAFSTIILSYSIYFIMFYLVTTVTHEAIITDEGITEKKLKRRIFIPWKEITLICEQRVPFPGSSMAKLLLKIWSGKRKIVFSSSLNYYEKLKEMILEKSEAKYFKHKDYSGGWGQEWVK